MGFVIAIITSGLAVSSFAYIFSPTYLTLGLGFGITCLVVLLGYFIERKIKTSGGVVLNRIFYWFYKNDKNYNYEDLKATYSCLDNDIYECKKILEIKSQRNDLQSITDSFCWSANSQSIQIDPINPQHQIKGLHQKNGWKHFSIDVGLCRKGKIVQTGSIIKGLHDPNAKPEPFFSYIVHRKTKVLVLNVEFPQKKRPKGNAVFTVKAGGKEIGKGKPLEFNASHNGFSVTIHYPRKEWTYIISWEE